MICKTLLGATMAIAAFLSASSGRTDVGFEGDSVVISGSVDDYRAGSAGTGSSSASWSSSGSGASSGWVLACARVDVVDMGTSVLQQCVREGGVAPGGPLVAILEPVVVGAQWILRLQW